MLLKYVLLPGELGDLAVRIGGFAHGFVFIAYGMTAVLVGVNQRWSLRLIAAAVGTAVVPYATIPFDRSLERRGRLDGDWRRTATNDPRDRTWVNVLLRVMLNRPILLGALFVVGLVSIMATLLVVGPPGGRS
jgi:integral membrane protein